MHIKQIAFAWNIELISQDAMVVWVSTILYLSPQNPEEKIWMFQPRDDGDQRQIYTTGQVRPNRK